MNFIFHENFKKNIFGRHAPVSVFFTDLVGLFFKKKNRTPKIGFCFDITCIWLTFFF